MAKSKQPPAPISDTLRQRVVDSGLSMKALAAATGVERMGLTRFVRGESRLRVDMADKLATYFGLELRAKD